MIMGMKMKVNKTISNTIWDNAPIQLSCNFGESMPNVYWVIILANPNVTNFGLKGMNI